ncbi:MAG: hypothetical protein P0S93_02270 [Candidatus Neptunochlamydia sp.]|nr:hypothetical protein [Candidatus Neptunochlamydia sp.]
MSIFLLSEAERVCPETREVLEKIGEEITQKLAFKPGSFFIKEFIKPRIMSHPVSKMNELLPDQWKKNQHGLF